MLIWVICKDVPAVSRDVPAERLVSKDVPAERLYNAVTHQ